MLRIAIILVIYLLSGSLSYSQYRETHLLNSHWNFVYGYEVLKNAGKLVQLPHTWNADDTLTGNLAYYR